MPTLRHTTVYIKGRGGGSVAHFRALAGDGMRIFPDTNAAVKTLGSSPSNYVIILYEYSDIKTDVTNIKFIRSWIPKCGIILISDSLDSDARKAYLEAGVNNAIKSSIDQETYNKVVRFITDYASKYKPVTTIASTEVSSFKMPLWKRTFDIVASAAALIVLSPLLIGVAIAIKFDSAGPIIYKSKRVGSNYKIFDFLKFRSMRINADKHLKEFGDLNQYSNVVLDGAESPSDGKINMANDDISQIISDIENGMLIADDFIISEDNHNQAVETEQLNAFVKIDNDPRVTPLGRFIRKYSIDELPQLVNILRGDMSVVGNRPLPLYEAENLTSDEYIKRFMCPSGLTGLWQVEKRGDAGALSPEQRKQLDIRYAETMSLWLDIKIILRTITTFIQKGNV